MQQKIIQKFASGIQSKALTRILLFYSPASSLRWTRQSIYQSLVEIPVEGVVERTSYISNVLKQKSQEQMKVAQKL